MRIWKNQAARIAIGKAALMLLKNPVQLPWIRSSCRFHGPVLSDTHSRSQHKAPKLRAPALNARPRSAKLYGRLTRRMSRRLHCNVEDCNVPFTYGAKHPVIYAFDRFGFRFPGKISGPAQGALGEPAAHRFVARDSNNRAAQLGLELAHIPDREFEAAVFIHDIRESTMVRAYDRHAAGQRFKDDG